MKKFDVYYYYYYYYKCNQNTVVTMEEHTYWEERGQ